MPSADGQTAGTHLRKRKSKSADEFCLQTVKTQAPPIFLFHFEILAIANFAKIFIFLKRNTANLFSMTPIFILSTFEFIFAINIHFYSVLLVPIEAQIFLANFQSSIGLKLSFKS